MTEIYLKKFEDRPDYWEGRYQSTLHTLTTLVEIGVSLDTSELFDIDDAVKQNHLETIAMIATEYEWEQNAK